MTHHSPTLVAALTALIDRLQERGDRRRQCRSLVALSDRALHDLGIGRAEAEAIAHGMVHGPAQRGRASPPGGQNAA